MRWFYEEGSGGKMKCKWNEKKECRLEEYLKRETGEQDCFFCIAVTFKGAAQDIMFMLFEVGARERTGEFYDWIKAFFILSEDFAAITEKYYPELLEIARQRTKEATVVAPYGIPKEMEEALRKFLNRAKDGVV